MKVLFIQSKSGRDALIVARNALPELEGVHRIGLVATAQHMHQLEGIRDELERNGKKVVIGGQVLGCNINNALRISDQVDAYLYIGSGSFHPGAFLSSEKSRELPLYTANPYSGSVNKIGPEAWERWLRKRNARIRRALEAKTFGIMVSTKRGQYNMDDALRIRTRLRDAEKEAFIYAGEELNPDRVLGVKVDAWINTACPRIVDDPFDKPVLNPSELDMMLAVGQ